MNPKTNCECSEPGFCPRHGCEKTPHWHHLCRTRPDYFELWEQKRGPGQFVPGSAGAHVDQSAGAAAGVMRPGLAQRAWNLATALAAFVVDGCQTVTEEQYSGRLQICDGCDQRRNNECLACGCHLPLKAGGRAMTCPLGKWPPIGEIPGVDTKSADNGQQPTFPRSAWERPSRHSASNPFVV